MKTILYFLIGFILCFSTPNFLNAQEVDDLQEAFANKEWYLTKIVMDGEEYAFVPTGAVPNSTLETYEVVVYNENVRCSFNVYNCEMCGTDAYFQSATEFKIVGGWNCLAYDNCMYSHDPYLLEFSYLYERAFWNFDDNNPTESIYEINITETEGHLSMVITKDGNQAYYSDEPLSIPSLEKNEITLYPNPVKDHLYIENLTENVQLEIYDLSGRKLLNQEINNSTQSVNVSQLSAGIYFYGLSQNGKRIKTGKLVKN